MDWILSFTTVVASYSLGWSKGKSWVWFLNAANSAVWVYYVVTIKQYGLILSAIVAIVLDLFSAVRAYKKEHQAKSLKEKNE